jgi:hypothetical protein
MSSFGKNLLEITACLLIAILTITLSSGSSDSARQESAAAGVGRSIDSKW